MPESKPLTSASNVLHAVLQDGKSPLSHQFLRWKLWRFWPQVVGTTISRYSKPVGYRRGRLYVWVNSSVRLQEMRFVAGPIKDKINKYLGHEWVNSIQFTLDEKSVPDLGQASDDMKKFLAEDSDSYDEEG